VDVGSPLIQSPVETFGISPPNQSFLFGPGSAPSDSLHWAHSLHTDYSNDSYFPESGSLNTNGDYSRASLLELDIADIKYQPYEFGSNPEVNTLRGGDWMPTSSSSSYPSLSPFESTSFFDSQPMIKSESIFSGTSNTSIGSAQDDFTPPDYSIWQSPATEEGSPDIPNLRPNMYRSAPASVPAPRSPNPKKGRKGPLTHQKRESTAYMRRIKACALCRKRKISCDDGIPCRACVKYLGVKLPSQPCRGEQLEDIASEIMRDNAFPKGNWEGRFLLDGFELDQNVHQIYLDLGFGQPFKCVVRLVQPLPDTGEAGGQSYLIHRHVEYPWPPVFGNLPRNDTQDWVFPAVLAISSEAQMEKEIDAYLSALLGDATNFRHFPLWMSKLELLKWIYGYYLSLPTVSWQPIIGSNRFLTGIQNARAPLEQALKLLILIHAGGDLRVEPEAVSKSIVRRYFPNIKLGKVTPCFIRAQLGPIFSRMSHKYMRQVLMELEILSPTDDSSKFPMIISSFSILMMAMESLQYHVTKLPYHTYHDGPTPDLAVWEPQTRDLDEIDKSDVLIRFYKATNCYARLRKLGMPEMFPGSNEFLDDAPGDAESKRVLISLHCAILMARPYLEAKRQRSVVPGTDMTAFFDRLLAKMFLIDPNV
jgi:hypothetical protein